MQNEELRLARIQTSVIAEKFVELYDFAPIGFFVLSAAGAIMESNFIGAKMLGKERALLINSQFDTYISSETRASFNLLFNRIFVSGVKESCDSILTSDGKEPAHVHFAGMAINQGKQCLISAVDITDRKQLENEKDAIARELNERVKELTCLYSIASIVENSDDSIDRMLGQIVNVIPSGWQYPAVTCARITIDYDDYRTPNYLETIWKQSSDILIHGKNCGCVEVLYLEEKSEMYDGPFLKEETKLLKVIAERLGRIIERKRAEAEIAIINEELIQLNAEKDKFFSIIAHDLRSPFNVLLGFTRMMVEDLPTLTLEEIQKIARSMRMSATNLYRLLENLLEWSRMQRGSIVFEPESFLLKQKIRESMHFVFEEAKKKGIRIIYDAPEDLEIFADAKMFESTIRNLASNAVKFTARGGKITIKAKPADGDSVEISIRDTGIGMSKEIMDQLFILDDKKSRKGTEGESGTGLGLIICKDFVDKHGSRINVESKEGHGSKFSFIFPVHAGNPAKR